MQMTDEDGALVIVVAITTVLLLGLSLIGFYHYGFYEGRSNVLDNQVCTPRAKP